MVFSSLLFLVAFLPSFLVAYYAVPLRLRNLVALGGSYVFYGWGAPRFVFVLIASSAADYLLSRLLERTSHAHPGRRRGLLVVSLALNLGLLAFFKYANFFAEEANRLIERFGGAGFHWVHIALPIGISFFTFQKITYIVDVYRGIVRPAGSFTTYALYVAMFPQLIAGPIVRYHDIADQLHGRTHSAEILFSGIWRFCLGLGKKVLVANALAEISAGVFELVERDLGPLPTTLAWVGILCYSFQIYFDFSGYSDMAIGLARMMGFRLLENFNCPYISASFFEFWRRWHISLSNFMREYLYIPLGGNRGSRWRTMVNLWVVFLLSGLWHGAGWTYVIWGAYHGLFLSIDKMCEWVRLPSMPRWLAVPRTFLLVTFGWVLFRCPTMSDSLQYMARLIGIAPSLHVETEAQWVILVSNRGLGMLLLAAVISFLPAWSAVGRWLGRMGARADTVATVWAKFAAAIALLVLSMGSLADLHFNPFIYFQF